MTGLTLLFRCRYCRNRIRYLYSPWFGWRKFSGHARRRIRALPLTHQVSHMDRGCSDAAPPIRWKNRVKATPRSRAQ